MLLWLMNLDFAASNSDAPVVEAVGGRLLRLAATAQRSR